MLWCTLSWHGCELYCVVLYCQLFYARLAHALSIVTVSFHVSHPELLGYLEYPSIADIWDEFQLCALSFPWHFDTFYCHTVLFAAFGLQVRAKQSADRHLPISLTTPSHVSKKWLWWHVARKMGIIPCELSCHCIKRCKCWVVCIHMFLLGLH